MELHFEEVDMRNENSQLQGLYQTCTLGLPGPVDGPGKLTQSY
jgi:hypothetical protein